MMTSVNPASEQKAKDAAFEASTDPIGLFERWFEDAKVKETDLPDAVALATTGADSMPDVRMVLLKSFDERGFVFYTNLESQKALELAENSRAALCFHWKSLTRQVRIQGIAEAVSDAQADAYFATRSKPSQIGAWASRQSRTLEGRFELETQVAKYTAKYAIKKVDRPPFWSGFRIVPLRIEFWRQRSFRLHDRRVFMRDDAGQKGWKSERLYP